ncbi:LXG domain of WXG superfamily protein [Evansella caseinilytica]|uniref:LXG domain of WXG superfamily protein n=1 Tax=Evansella caseinilytica TaxID=1503961 RepID=A0A1H3RI16_9BACI|nr:T7SS effector LXG polymorphic toxin [Evansella caseinilytica]SDZ24871.1 LXG domain of WXG superfamily protein [Evansella caseinilytica]
MDTFKGRTADAAKAYFTETHGTILTAFQQLFRELQQSFDKHIQSFRANVDTHPAAVIESNYLQDTLTEIDREFRKIEDIQQAIQYTIQGVSDITSAAAPPLAPVAAAKWEVEHGITKLDQNVFTFTREGRRDIDNTRELLYFLEKAVHQAGAEKGETRFTNFQHSTTKQDILALKDVVTGIKGTDIFDTEFTRDALASKDVRNSGGLSALLGGSVKERLQCDVKALAAVMAELRNAAKTDGVVGIQQQLYHVLNSDYLQEIFRQTMGGIQWVYRNASRGHFQVKTPPIKRLAHNVLSGDYLKQLMAKTAVQTLPYAYNMGKGNEAVKDWTKEAVAGANWSGELDSGNSERCLGLDSRNRQQCLDWRDRFL